MQKLRKRTWMGRLAAVVMAAAVLVLAGAFVSLADESGDTTRFVSGTKVNGVGVGGLTVDEAKARIEGFYAGEYNLTIRERGGRQETIAGTDIGYKVEVPEGLKAILDAQNAAGRRHAHRQQKCEKTFFHRYSPFFGLSRNAAPRWD